MRSLLQFLVLVGPVLFAGLPATAQTDGRAARDHMVVLSDDIGQRLAGSAEDAEAAGYIEGVFRDLGYETTRQGFPFVPESGRRGASLVSANIVSFRAGESEREIVVGAHYDSEERGRGAGDNASGVGVLLEVAAALGSRSTPYSIRFVAFGAEEQGLAGSRHYVSEMSSAQIDRTVAFINLDSLVAGEIPYVYGDFGDAGRIRNWVLAQAVEQGIELTTQEGLNPEYPAGTTCDCSDHVPFREAGIPYAYFESTNWSLGDGDGYTQVDARFGDGGRIWHTRFDTIEYIDATFPGRIDQRLELFSSMVYRVLTEFREPGPLTD